MKIRTDEIASVIKQEIDRYAAELEVSEVGRVVSVGDGIAQIYGLSNAMASELLEFQTGDGAVDPLDVGFVLARFGPCE